MKSLVVFNPILETTWHDRSLHAVPNEFWESFHTLRGIFDSVFVIVDYHRADDIEFEFLPLHLTSRIGQQTISLGLNEVFLFKKNTLSCCGKPAHRKAMTDIFGKEKMGEVYLAGVSLSLDILPSALDLLQMGINVVVDKDFVCDISEEHKSTALKYLGAFGATGKI